jgi:CBS-domain-containing membrane protein
MAMTIAVMGALRTIHPSSAGLTLFPVSFDGPMYTPKDWTGLPDGAPQVAALVRRTQRGIY